jgi:hypothetical protein
VLTTLAGAVIALPGEAALVDDPHHADTGVDRGGDQLLDEDLVDLGLDVVVTPGGDIDELLQCEDLAVADIEGDRLDALAFG